MRVLVTGSTGLIGRKLCSSLEGDGHLVSRLVRTDPRGSDEIYWDPTNAVIDTKRLDDLDAVVHLAGENVAAGRWNLERKKKIRDSRIMGTRLLTNALQLQKSKPPSFLCASAIGFYGNRGEESLTEISGPGSDFLATVCEDWEAEAKRAEQHLKRVVSMRIGVVLSKNGGALSRMLPAFRFGLGGRLGNGRQYLSWISHDDVVAAIRFLLEREELSGAFNLTAPSPVTNSEFTRTLGSILRRPTLLPVPAFALRMMAGELADTLLLTSSRVLPERLEQAGFEFKLGHLAEALQKALRAKD